MKIITICCYTKVWVSFIEIHGPKRVHYDRSVGQFVLCFYQISEQCVSKPNTVFFFRRRPYNLGKSLQDKLDRNKLREGLPMTKLRNTKTIPNSTLFTP